VNVRSLLTGGGRRGVNLRAVLTRGRESADPRVRLARRGRLETLPTDDPVARALLEAAEQVLAAVRRA
jgi:hypothetical protein